MRILVIGSGGREHAIVHTIAHGGSPVEIITAPGNAGTLQYGRNVPIPADAIEDLMAFVLNEEVDLVIIGPEGPLVMGLADRLREVNVPVVGPSRAASRLEGSKVFAKAFMARHRIPTADYRAFDRSEADAAREYVRDVGAPIVIKASGLAAGKGAIVCSTEEEALDTISSILEAGALGSAGNQIILEQFMEGEEASVFALTDGIDYVLLPTAQDHKQIGEGDTGPNTGGMGAYAPAPVMTPELLELCCRTIIEPTLKGMREDGNAYEGVLYCGLMITRDGPKVVEFNCRLGDPETQVVLPLLASDPIELFENLAKGTLKDYTISFRSGSAACVVLSSNGYPGDYEIGKPIKGMDAVDEVPDTMVFLAGVRTSEAGALETSGGRVLAVTGLGADLADALAKAYDGVEKISFDGKYFRRDIGNKGLNYFKARS